MKAIVVTDQAAGTAGMNLMARPEPRAAINDVVVQIHASGFVPTELTWPSTWTDRRGRDRTPSIPGHELAGVVPALGYGTTGLSVGQRVFGLADWYRDGTLAEYVAIEARNSRRCRATLTSQWARAFQSRASPRGRDCSSTAAFGRGKASSRTARPAQSGRW
jgi:NADPH:quinone reductase-like Zn-dependent oxidoreductase